MKEMQEIIVLFFLVLFFFFFFFITCHRLISDNTDFFSPFHVIGMDSYVLKIMRLLQHGESMRNKDSFYFFTSKSGG
jgi:hypothetical protein